MVSPAFFKAQVRYHPVHEAFPGQYVSTAEFLPTPFFVSALYALRDSIIVPIITHYNLIICLHIFLSLPNCELFEDRDFKKIS